MSAGNSFDNPYAAPRDSSTGPISPAQKPPGAFLAIAIVGIVFGCIGLFNGFCGAIGLALLTQSEQVSGLLDELGQQQSGDERMQMDLMKVALEAGSKTLPMTMAILIISLLISGVMLIGGILGVMKRRSGVSWLIAACGLSMLLTLGRPVVEIINTQTVSAAQKEFLSNEMGAGPEQIKTFETAQQVQGVIQIVFGIVSALTMLVAYGVSLWYLVSSRRLREYFSASAVR